MFKNRISLFV